MKKTDQIHGKAYKLFYLADDHTNSVFEKVFICAKDVLNSIKFGLQGNIELVGLVGSVKEICRFFVRSYSWEKKQGEQNKDYQLKLIQNGMNIDLQHIASNQKPSVYLIKLPQNPHSLTQKIYLTLISNPQLYYQKPYDQKSLAYLLIRFIGDLTNDILLFYDTKMLAQFNENDCPFASMNNRFMEMEIQETNISTIHLKDVGCQSNEVLELDEKKYINWMHSLVVTQNSYLQYFQLFDESSMESRENLDRKSKKQIIWKKILEDGLAHDTLGADQTTENIPQYKQAIKQLKGLHGRIKKQIENLTEKCYRSLQYILYKQKNKIEDFRLSQQIDKQIEQIYYRVILQQGYQPKIENNKIIIKDTDQIARVMEKQSYKLLGLFYSMINSEDSQVKTDEIKQQMLRLCNESVNLLNANIFPKFFQLIEIVLETDQNLYKKREKIEITRFQLIKTHNNNNQITKIEFKKQPKSIVFLNQLKKHVPKIQLHQIKDIKIFKAKFIRQCRVLLVSKQIQKEREQKQFLLMIIERGEIKLIAKYVQKQLIFTFDEKSRKVFLLKPNSTQKILTTFILDEFQKPKNEKQYYLAQSDSNFQIISYSISKTPNQRFYYLDSRKDALYCYDLTEKSCKQFYTEDRTLRPLRGRHYQSVKAFNHNIYIVLGNREVIDVYLMTMNGELSTIARTFQCKQNTFWRGMSTYYDERNQYLVAYGQNQFQLTIFENMGSDNFIRQTQRKINLGNPIIDIFYEAQDKFGQYTTYTVCKNTPNKKKINLYHIIEQNGNKEKIQSYLQLISIRNHEGFIYYQNELEQVYKNNRIKFLSVSSTQFVNEAQSRIPVQICSVQFGNIRPLKQGNIIDNFDGQQVSIQQRCRVLTFGIVERMLKQETKNRTIVVSVMGGQSTGKSYLLNRIFGTRFTVASCRTTIGIWASLIKTQNINFLILDCEGLFGIHREMNQQQKLIKILTSVSDFTILNLSKGMANRGHIELMVNLSKSVSRTQIKSQQLYNGDLFIVVRDVAQGQQQGIIRQLQSNFHQHSGIRQFMKTLFSRENQNQKLSIYNFPTFTETETFAKSAQDMKKKFIEKSNTRPIRNSETVLNWLKIVMNQLACDDANQLPEQVMENRIIQLIQEKAEEAWTKGSDTGKFQDEIMGITLCIQDSEIELQVSNNFQPLQKFFIIFKEKVKKDKVIDSVSFAQDYRNLNDYIVKFFDQRQKYTRKILSQHVKNIPNKDEKLTKKIEEKLKSSYQKIRLQKQGLRLCLQQCSTNCEQPCIKIYQHKTKITEQIKTLSGQLAGKMNDLNQHNLDEQQKKSQQTGIKKLKQQCSTKIQQIQKILIKFEQKSKLYRKLQEQKKQKYPIENQITNLTNSIKTNNKYQEELITVLKDVKSIFKLYQQFIQKYVKNSGENFGKQLSWISENKQVLRQLLQKVSQRKYYQTDFDLQEILAKSANISVMIQELVEGKTQIQSLANSTSTQIAQLTAQIAQHKTQQQQMKSDLSYFGNMSIISTLQSQKKQAQTQLQKIQGQKQDRQLQLTKLNKIMGRDIYKVVDKEGHIIQSITALMKKKKELLSVYHKQVAFVEEQVNEMYREYNIKQSKISQLQKKLKFLISRKATAPQQIQILKQKKSMLTYLQSSKQTLKQKTAEYNSLKQKVMQQYNLQQNRHIYNQQIALIEYICDSHDDPDYLERICMYIGIFGDYYNSDQILKLCWFKIMESFDEADRSIISKEVSEPEDFYKKIIELNRIQKEKQIQQRQQEYQSIEKELQQLYDNQFNSSISSIGNENENSLEQKQSFIKGLIEYDRILLKCQEICKKQCIGYFMRMVNYLGRFCETDTNSWKYNTVQIIKKNNPQLVITLTEQGLVQISGKFTQSFSELSKDLQDQSFSYQKQLYAIQVIPQHSFLFQLRKKIQNIQKYHIDCNKFNLFLMYIEKVSSHFSDGEMKIRYQHCVINKWLQILSQQENGGQQDKQKIFLSVLLRSCLQICGTMQKMKENYKRYQQNKSKLQQQLLPMRKQQQIKQQRLQQINDQIHQKEKQNSKSVQPESFLNSQGLIQQKQKQLKNISAKLKQSSKELEQLEERKILFDQFVQKIGNAKKIKVNLVLESFLKEAKQNIIMDRKIEENELKIDSIRQIKQKISKEINQLEQFLKQFHQQSLRKQLKYQEQTNKNLIILEKKIDQIAQLTQQVESLQKQIEKLKKSSQIQCSCLTNHKCDRKCEVGCNRADKFCLQKAGHKGKHACNDHKCGQKCQIDVKCANGCMKVYAHTKDQVHNCGQTHSCKSKCKYCDKKCRKSLFQQHQQHNCGQQKCPQKCILCNQNCNSLAHNHNSQAEIITIYKQNKPVKKRLHLCSSSHPCQNLCNHTGICSNSYAQKDGFWQNKDGVLTKYQYIQQIDIKKQCIKQIDAFSYKHEGECLCDVNHTCTYRCPDCKSLCSAKYGHQNFHDTTHRNQEFLIWAAEQQDKVYTVSQNNQKFIFNVGQISLPFKCNQSCLRKGRGHFHLIQCPGGQSCYEKKLKQGAKHSNKVYKPHKDKKYDMLLCHKYWEVYNFKMPVEDNSFKKCNFACTIIEEHKDKGNSYCEKQAWHSISENRIDHEFLCHHKKLSINAIEICFLLDMSGSMFDYHKKSKETIERIIKSSAKTQLQKMTIKFAVVGYRDHRMSESDLFKKLKKLCIQKKKTLLDLPLEGAFTQLMTQATFEDILIKLQRTYNYTGNQQNLLQKFKQEQKLILKYHYPFVLDEKSSRRFLDEKRRQKRQKHPYMKLREFQQPKVKNLKELLIGQLDYFIKEMQRQTRQEVINAEKHKLLECLKFTTPEDCMKFLDKLQAVGGGDPPEAVLDGMAAASELGWSSGDNTARYIFHLFDAPPHGENYDNNNEDYYPQGCPCNKKADQIIKKIMKTKINYIFYPYTNRVNRTFDVFKSLGLEYQVKEIKNAKNSQQFIEHASLLICKQIEQTEITVRK